ncbi:MAG: VTC domain-containing protein [Myxococcales bacterium FL481]|nr:MAG: VTC domain-containing protein [Myxococcales bacterium FL481]
MPVDTQPGPGPTATLETTSHRPITADRRELCYRLTTRDARTVSNVVAQHLPRHRFAHGDGLPPSQAQSYITTVYFDTAARDVARACTRGDTSLKLRTKEYYEYFPSMTEVATDTQQLVFGARVLWLETKRRIGQRTTKNRFGVPKADLLAFFRDSRITEEMVGIQMAEYGDAAEDVVADLAELCRPYDSPLRADCLVNYRRRAWQDPHAKLRVTIDSQLAFYLPPDDLWQRADALTHDDLGTPVARFDGCVLELKSRGPHPSWLTALLAEVAVQPARLPTQPQLAFSKFLAGTIAVRGPLEQAPGIPESR